MECCFQTLPYFLQFFIELSVLESSLEDLGADKK